MRRVLVWVATLVAGAGLATAQDFPDIKGTWTGTNEAVVIGNPVHTSNPNANSQEPGLTGAALTLTITGQKGRRFWGTFASAAGSEPIIGVFRDESTFVITDHDGHSTARLLPDGTIELVYQRVGDTMVAAFAHMKRR